MRRILIACAVLAAAGCANHAPTFDDLTPAQRQKLLGMQYSSDRPDRPYTVLGHVDGEACSSSAAVNREDAENKAMEGAMAKAVLLGADGVTNTYCQSSSGRDLLSFCSEPVKCNGEAIKFTNPADAQPVAPPAPLPPQQPAEPPVGVVPEANPSP
jgi:hypothetical protein